VKYDRPPVYVPASPEYILAVIRDSHRQQCQSDPEAESGVELTFETTVDEWRYACDLLDWPHLARGLADQWKLDCPDDAWRNLLEPATERTLHDLCEFLARGATRPSVDPVRIMGTSCLTAGAFLTIRWILRDAGADVVAVTPSTPLCEYTRRYRGVFLGPISWLAESARDN
jgi:hypothetical protein